jgi:hypothetical protein
MLYRRGKGVNELRFENEIPPRRKISTKGRIRKRRDVNGGKRRCEMFYNEIKKYVTRHGRLHVINIWYWLC